MDIRDDHARKSLADMELPHQSQPHQSFPRASLWITVSQIPAGGSESRARRGGGIVVVAAGHRSGAGVGEFLASSREIVFFVTDHDGVVERQLERER